MLNQFVTTKIFKKELCKRNNKYNKSKKATLMK